MLRLRRLLAPLLIAGVAAGGCSGTTNPSRFVDVSIRPDSAIFASATSIGVTVVVRNRGFQFVQTAPPQAYACYPAFQVLLATRDSVVGPQYAVQCALVLAAPIELAPGDSIVIHNHWIPPNPYSPSPLPAGTYRVRADVTVNQRQLYSPTATIVIAPPG